MIQAKNQLIDLEIRWWTRALTVYEFNKLVAERINNNEHPTLTLMQKYFVSSRDILPARLYHCFGLENHDTITENIRRTAKENAREYFIALLQTRGEKNLTASDILPFPKQPSSGLTR